MASWNQINDRWKELALKGWEIDVGPTLQPAVVASGDWKLAAKRTVRTTEPGLRTDRYRALYEMHEYYPPNLMKLYADENGEFWRDERQPVIFTKVDTTGELF